MSRWKQYCWNSACTTSNCLPLENFPTIDWGYIWIKLRSSWVCNGRTQPSKKHKVTSVLWTDPYFAINHSKSASSSRQMITKISRMKRMNLSNKLKLQIKLERKEYPIKVSLFLLIKQVEKPVHLITLEKNELLKHLPKRNQSNCMVV